MVITYKELVNKMTDALKTNPEIGDMIVNRVVGQEQTCYCSDNDTPFDSVMIQMDDQKYGDDSNYAKLFISGSYSEDTQKHDKINAQLHVAKRIGV